MAIKLLGTSIPNSLRVVWGGSLIMFPTPKSAGWCVVGVLVNGNGGCDCEWYWSLNPTGILIRRCSCIPIWKRVGLQLDRLGLLPSIELKPTNFHSHWDRLLNYIQTICILAFSSLLFSPSSMVHPFSFMACIACGCTYLDGYLMKGNVDHINGRPDDLI